MSHTPLLRFELRKRVAPSGFSLMEVVLVLALIMLVLAAAIPMTRAVLEDERLRNAADRVQAAWVTARVEAMASGDHVIFRYEPGTGLFELAGTERVTSLDGKPSELPEGITFATSTKAADAREGVEEGLSGGAAASVNEPEIWFYPDGTSSDVRELLLRNESGTQIRLTLRGLTGVPRIDEDVPAAEDGRLAPIAR